MNLKDESEAPAAEGDCRHQGLQGGWGQVQPGGQAGQGQKTGGAAAACPLLLAPLRVADHGAAGQRPSWTT